MRTYVLLMVGRQNIKDDDTEIIRKSLEAVTLKVGVIVLSNDEKVQELFDSNNKLVKVYGMLDRKSYLRVIEKVDSLLLFVTDIKTEFSSNKMFDALCRGKPILVGFRNLTQSSSVLSKIPGIVAFDVTDPEAIENSFEKLSRIITDDQMQKNMSNFSIELYMSQKKGLLEFLREILQIKAGE